MSANNNLTAGQSAIKVHVWNGSKTLCNKKSLYTESKDQFKKTLSTNPGICCANCAKKIDSIK